MADNPGTPADTPFAEGNEAFEKDLYACVADINKLLPGLSRRYDMAVVVTAMAEHVGSALKVLMRAKLCNARQADLAIQRIEDCAFPENTTQH